MSPFHRLFVSPLPSLRLRARGGIALFTLGFALHASASGLALAPCFGDRMVLQRDMPLAVFGSAAPAETVDIAFRGAAARAVADSGGAWRATLPAGGAGGPFELGARTASQHVLLQDVWVGEVWVGGGQSNMEIRMAASAFPTTQNADTAAHADIPGFRLYDMRNPGKGWMICSPATAPLFSATAFYFGRELNRKLGVPVGMVLTAKGGTTIDTWLDPASVAADSSLRASAATSENFSLYVAPVIPMAMRGVVWYQGESDESATLSKAYGKRFHALIRGWRARWGRGDFPFLFAQLCGRHALQSAPVQDEGSWPAIREAQRGALDLPHTAMAVLFDLYYRPNPDEVHPPEKHDVGLRLSLAARAVAYGETGVEYTAPLYDTFAIEGKRVRLKFTHGAQGFRIGTAGTGPAVPAGFAIAGEDGRWHWAQAEIQGPDIVAWNDSVASPVAVRYGWANNPISNLYGGSGLPVSPFGTQSPRLPTAIDRQARAPGRVGPLGRGPEGAGTVDAAGRASVRGRRANGSPGFAPSFSRPE